MQVILQPAYLLHIRPYRETSSLAEFFTRDFGRVSAVIKGMRKIRSRYHGIRSFMPLLISYQGKSDLFNLTDLEYVQMPYLLLGDVLFCGFYLNELLIRLLLPQDPYPSVFSNYEMTLQAIDNGALQEIEPFLRQFELSLLAALGYGFSLDQTEKQDPVLEDNYYLLDPKTGLIHSKMPLQTAFKGKHLLNFKQNTWDDIETRIAAKRLMQLAFAPLLGNKPLKTRVFFKAKSNTT